jgi:diadenosine tetraphosphatase ApaH/serine/threonine PP2A family protein phosphatase
MEFFTELAQESARWTMEHLTPENRTYLRELPEGPAGLEQSLVLVHGSPRDEDEYVTNIQEATEIFTWLAGQGAPDWPFFFGHTHLQGAFYRLGGRVRGISSPLAPVTETNIRLQPDAAYLINPGSVGQPRDGDPRAAYVIFDTEKREVLLRRTEYDYQPTQNKILVAGLPPKLGLRLAVGR